MKPSTHRTCPIPGNTIASAKMLPFFNAKTGNFMEQFYGTTLYGAI